MDCLWLHKRQAQTSAFHAYPTAERKNSNVKEIEGGELWLQIIHSDISIHVVSFLKRPTSTQSLLQL
jgi:hypothetical protein